MGNEVKYKKGTEVYVVGQYDRKGQVYVERQVVQACGAKIIRCTKADNGKFIKHNHYVDQLNRTEDSYRAACPWMFPVEGTDIEAEALALGEHFLNMERSSKQRRIDNATSDSDRAYFQKELDALLESPVLLYR